MIDYKESKDPFEAMDAECKRLRAENARLRAMLDIASRPRKGSKKCNPKADYGEARTNAERNWLVENLPEEARHWNLVTDLRPEHLHYNAA